MFPFSCIVFIAAAAIYLLADSVNEGRRPIWPGRDSWRWISMLAVRSGVAGAITWLAYRDLLTAAIVTAGCFALPFLRRFTVPNRYGAELEILGVATALALFYWAMISRGLHFVPAPRLTVNPKLTAVSLIASVVIFQLRGGTYIVRGILKRAESLPMTGVNQDRSLDEKEINRGRIIGNLERIILMIVVAKGSYEALGFLVAAKGLIRSEHFNNRDWAEYFLIGSLASVLLALLAGWIVSAIAKMFWI